MGSPGHIQTLYIDGSERQGVKWRLDGLERQGVKWRFGEKWVSIIVYIEIIVGISCKNLSALEQELAELELFKHVYDAKVFRATGG